MMDPSVMCQTPASLLKYNNLVQFAVPCNLSICTSEKKKRKICLCMSVCPYVSSTVCLSLYPGDNPEYERGPQRLVVWTILGSLRVL